ncbi:MAG: phosphoribosylanthranilate isomerase [Prevotella sp.]|nr:phosphoribosylanthranilate isomerase [Prevotella sp.]
MIVKVCGMREADNIRAVSALGVDMLGFIFWPESPRFVRMISSQAGIMPDYSRERLSQLRSAAKEEVQETAPQPQRVGVFVDDMPQNIVTRVYNYNLDFVQLHGSESPVMIENLRRTLEPDIRPGVKIIKALSIRTAEDLAQYKQYEDVVDLFLFDTKCPSVGGSGQQFDWQLLSAYDGKVPFLLSGGIGPDDVVRIRTFSHPQFAGIDLNSRFEVEPGVKDVELLSKFLNELKA